MSAHNGAMKLVSCRILLAAVSLVVSAMPMLLIDPSISPAVDRTEPMLTQTWRSPTPAPVTIENGFQAPAHQYASGHRGIDVKTTPGTPVSAPASGSVHFVGVVAHKPVLTIRVNERTVYSFEPLHSDLRVGDAVLAGELLGSTTEGGHCESRCLHFGVRVDDEYVNPFRFLTGRPTLLPGAHASLGESRPYALG